MSDVSWDERLKESAITLEVNPQNVPRRGDWDHPKAAWNEMDRYYGRTLPREDGLAGVVVVPTGGGKTVLACDWLLKNHVGQGGRVLWLTHRHSLLRQSYNEFARSVGFATGAKELSLIRVSGVDKPWSSVAPDDDLVFSTLQSAVRNESRVLNMADQSDSGLFVVVDEAHHAAAPKYLKLLEELKQRDVCLLGLTATPLRTDEKDQARLQNVFDHKILYQISQEELIGAKILAHPDPVTVETKIDFEREFNEDDFKHLERFGDLTQRVRNMLAKHAPRNELIVKHYKDRSPDYGKTIVFAANILHARTLAKEFNEQGVNSDYVDSCRSIEENRHAIESFLDRAGIPVIVNVEMLTEGFDAPKTRTVFLAKPVASQILFRQMVGRALRGPAAGGGEIAYIVSFLDAWKIHKVLSPEYIWEPMPVTPKNGEPSPPRPPTVVIPQDLVDEIYRILKSIIKQAEMLYFDNLPHGWFSWEEELEDDTISRHVLVFEDQKEAFDDLYREVFARPEAIPEEITDGFVEKILDDYFGDIRDPIPTTHDIRSLLWAYKEGKGVVRYTIEDKATIDPRRVALDLVKRNVPPQQQRQEIEDFYSTHPLCAALYPGDSGKRDYFEDVFGCYGEFFNPPIPSPTPQIVDSIRTPIQIGEPGYSLREIWDVVTSQKRHFPAGVPKVSDYRYSKKPLKSCWAFFRYSDSIVVISRQVYSPDVPRFVVEFLMYHEILHADLPNSGHKGNFRTREKNFTPSDAAIADATKRKFTPGNIPDAWRVLADQWLDTCHRRFRIGEDSEKAHY